MPCTFWDAGDDETHGSAQEQKEALAFLPPKPLQQEDTAEASWYFHSSEHKLHPVNVQAKTPHVKAQAIVHQAVHKPECKAEQSVYISRSVVSLEDPHFHRDEKYPLATSALALPIGHCYRLLYRFGL